MKWLSGKELKNRAIVDMDENQYMKLEKNLNKLFSSFEAAFADDDRMEYLKLIKRIKVNDMIEGIQYLPIYMGGGSEAIFKCKI